MTWSKPVNISKNSRDSEEPAIGVDNSGNIFVAWMDKDNSTQMSDICFKYSDLKDLKWSHVKHISLSGKGFNPKISVDTAGNVNLVYMELSSGWKIKFARTTDKGQSWKPVIETGGEGFFPSISQDSSGNIYIVFERDGIKFLKSKF